jgi:hypothetical protein
MPAGCFRKEAARFFCACLTHIRRYVYFYIRKNFNCLYLAKVLLNK